MQSLVAVSHEPVNKETESQDGKVQSGIVVVDVGNTCHDDERQVVQEPTNNGVDTRVVHLVEFLLVEVLEATLPAQDVPNNGQTDESQSHRASPVDKGVSEQEVLDNVVVPAAHTKTNVKNGPLPPLGGQVVLLVGIGNQGVVGGHHGDVQVDEVVEKRRLVDTGVAWGELVVGVSLHVPVSVGIAGVVVLGAGNFNLLETPLRQVPVGSSEVAAENRVLETESGGQSADSASIARGGVAKNFNLPVVLVVTNSQVTVARNFLVGLGHRGSDFVGVQVAASLGVEQTDSRAVTNEAKLFRLRVVVLLTTVGVDEPVVVGVLVVVASNLLLLRTVGVGLNVRVQQTATITHVLDGSTRADGNFQGAVLADLSALQVGLEKRAHLGVTWSGSVEDSEVQSEGEHVDKEWNDDQTDNTSDDVGTEGRLKSDVSTARDLAGHLITYEGHLGVTELVPEILNGVQTDESRDEETDELDRADAANAEAGEEKPEEPFGFEAVVALVVELGPTENCSHGTAEQHGVE